MSKVYQKSEALFNISKIHIKSLKKYLYITFCSALFSITFIPNAFSSPDSDDLESANVSNDTEDQNEDEYNNNISDEKYQIYTLSNLWAPIVYKAECKPGERNDSESLSLSKMNNLDPSVGYRFVVHGLWNGYYDNSNGQIELASNCPVSTKNVNLDDFENSKVKDRLNEEYFKMTACLYVHEWVKHGGCVVGDNEKPEVYFEKVFDSMDKYIPQSGIDYLKESVNKKVSYQDLETKFDIDPNIGFPVFTCKRKKIPDASRSSGNAAYEYSLNEYRFFFVEQDISSEDMEKLRQDVKAKQSHCPEDQPILIKDFMN